MLKLFTTKSCTQCPTVISALDSNEVDYEMIDAEDYPDDAAEHGIMSVPTLVDEDNGVHVGTAKCLELINQ